MSKSDSKKDKSQNKPPKSKPNPNEPRGFKLKNCSKKLTSRKSKREDNNGEPKG